MTPDDVAQATAELLELAADLERVSRAVESVRRARVEYRVALRAARNAGAPVSAIAAAAGVSRQAVDEILRRPIAPRESNTVPRKEGAP